MKVTIIRSMLAILCIIAICVGILVPEVSTSASTRPSDTHLSVAHLFTDGSTFRLHNLDPDLKTYCLGITNASLLEGAYALVWTCNTNKDQIWEVQNGQIVNNAFYFQLKNTNSNQCLGFFESSTTEGEIPIQWPCNNNLDQQWSYIPSGNTFHLQNRNDNQCLGVFDADVYMGAYPVQWACNSNKDQFWG